MTFKPQRRFTADEGVASLDDTLSGPNTIEADLDQVNKMFDPSAVHVGGQAGGIGEGNIQAGAATDSIVGVRTLTDSVAPTSETGLISTLLGGISYMVKAITGQASWRTPPDKNLTQVYSKTETYSQSEVNGIAAGFVLGELSPGSVTNDMLDGYITPDKIPTHGVMSTLDTTDKTTLVDAVNEVLDVANNASAQLAPELQRCRVRSYYGM